MISRLKERKFAHLVFSLRFPFSIEQKQHWGMCRSHVVWKRNSEFPKNYSRWTRPFFQNNEAEKAFDEAFEKARNLDFSGVHDDKEAIDHICEKYEISPGLAAYFKDSFSYDLDLTEEENFRKLLRGVKENLIEQKEP